MVLFSNVYNVGFKEILNELKRIFNECENDVKFNEFDE